MKSFNLFATVLLAFGLVGTATAQQSFSANGVQAELLAPGAWGVYMQLTNTSAAPAMIIEVQSPQFANAELVVRSRDRFQTQSALLFSAGESGELRDNASHVLLTGPLGDVGDTTLVFKLSDGTESRFIFNIRGDTVARAKAGEMKKPAQRIESIEPQKEKRSSRVISHNPVRR